MTRLSPLTPKTPSGPGGAKLPLYLQGARLYIFLPGIGVQFKNGENYAFHDIGFVFTGFNRGYGKGLYGRHRGFSAGF
jgi:hypothetical protein